MKNITLGLLIAISTVSCQSKSSKVNIYLSESQHDSLLTNIVTFIYSLAPNATAETRFQPLFRGFYTKNTTKFTLENLQQTSDGWNYFFLIRPVGGGEFKRGVLGKFKLKGNSTMPTEFEEIANTPHLKTEVVKERGEFLFRELLKNGNLKAQIPMKQYIEWPDEHLAYDKKVHEWKVVKPY